MLLSFSVCDAEDGKPVDPNEPIKRLFAPIKILDAREEEAQAFQAWLAGGLRPPQFIQLQNRADAENDVVAIPQTSLEHANEVLDKILFGPETIGADDARGRLDKILDVKIRLIDRLCDLSEAQICKLRLAGRGDVHRLFERARRLREKLPGAIADGVTLEFARETRDLHYFVRHGAFDEGSMFTKSLRKTLTSERAAEYNRQRGEARPKVRELLPELRIE